jgi:hypothetical protein
MDPRLRGGMFRLPCISPVYCTKPSTALATKLRAICGLFWNFLNSLHHSFNGLLATGLGDSVVFTSSQCPTIIEYREEPQATWRSPIAEAIPPFYMPSCLRRQESLSTWSHRIPAFAGMTACEGMTALHDGERVSDAFL